MKGVGRMYNGVTLWQPVFLWNWERPVSSQLPSEAARLCGTRVWKPHLLKDTVETEIQGSPWKGHSPSWDRQSLLPPVYPHHPLSNSWRCEFSRWCDIGAVTPCHPIGLASDLEYHLVTVPSLLRLGVTILHLLRSESLYPPLSQCHLTFQIQSPVILVPQF